MFNKKKKENIFYKAFYELAEFSRDAMAILSEEFMHFSPEKAQDIKEQVHAIEHKADIRKKEIEEVLAKEFITPIDREDIFILLDEIDDLTDSIDEISYLIYLRCYKELPEDTGLFVQKSGEAIEYLMDLFENFELINDKEKIMPLINNVLKVEEEADKLYEDHVHNLYKNELDYKELRMKEAIYQDFEDVTDKCRDICKRVLIIVYKNL